MVSDKTFTFTISRDIFALEISAKNSRTIGFSSVIVFVFLEHRDARSKRYSLPPRTSFDDGAPGNNNNNGKNDAR